MSGTTKGTVASPMLRIAVLVITVVLCGSGAPAEARLPKLAVSAGSVDVGESLRVSGTGWPRLRGVSLYLTRRGDRRKRVAIVRVDRGGQFSKRVRIAAKARAGRYIVTACTARCRRAQTRRITVTPRRAPVAPVAPTVPVAPVTPEPVGPTPPAPVMSLAQWQAFLNDTVLTTASSSSSFGGRYELTDLTLCQSTAFKYESDNFNNGFEWLTAYVGTWRIVELTRNAEAAADVVKLELVLSDSTDSDFDPGAPESVRTRVRYVEHYDDGRIHCCGGVPALKAAVPTC